MSATQHPPTDEIHAYVLNQLRPPKSVRMAEHLLTCRDCLDRAAHIDERLDLAHRYIETPPHFSRFVSSAWQAWSHPASGLVTASAAVLLLSIGLGHTLTSPPVADASANIAMLNAPRQHVGPVPGHSTVEPVVSEPVVVARSVTPRHRRQKRTPPSRTFTAPDSTPAFEVGYLLPPPSPLAVNPAATKFAFARVSTEVGEPPAYPVKHKRHPIVRFFGAIAKPFRSDRT